MLKCSELCVGCSGASGGATDLNLAFFTLSVFGATGGAFASSGPGHDSSFFAGAACFATSAALTLGVSESSGVSLANSALRCVTAGAFCFVCSAALDV